MGIRVSTTADGIGVMYTSWGVLTGDELIEADQRVADVIKRNPGIRYLFVDHGAEPSPDIDTRALKQVASHIGERLEPLEEGLIAVAAPSDILFGLSRMWETLTEHERLTTRITRTRADALEWLEEQLSRRGLPFRLT